MYTLEIVLFYQRRDDFLSDKIGNLIQNIEVCFHYYDSCIHKVYFNR